MAKEVLHVVPAGDGWAVKKEGNERSSSSHDTQKAAIDQARDMAKEGDEIVVHRADGSIRDHTTYTGASSNGNGNANTAGRGDRGDRPEAHDIWSTGTRIRWAPIFAGVVSALAIAALLSALASAIGLSTMDTMRPRTVSIIAGITWMVIMITALFAGGYIATQTTTRETKFEAVLIGLVVWGTTFALSTMGLMAGSHLALNATRTASEVNAQQPFWKNLGWDQNRANRYQAMTSPDTERVRSELNLSADEARAYDEARQADDARNTNPRSAAWWIFGGMALSLAASIFGAIAGAGPEVTRRLLHRETTGSDLAPATVNREGITA